MTLRPVDRVLLGYITVTSAVAIARLASAPGAGWVLVANLLIALLIALIVRAPDGAVGPALAELYPVFILLGLYGALDLLSGSGRVRVHDPSVQRWEAAIFGGQISREWWRRSPSALWSTLLHSAYLSYYFIVPAGPLWFLHRRELSHLRRVVLALVSTFVTCYLVFIFFPVAGPYYEFPRPAASFLDNAPARLVYAVLAGGSSYGAAFPSSHVAVVIAAAVASAQGSRGLGLLLGVPALLLTVAVVYCQMHYGVDAIAGVLVGLGVVAAVNRRWPAGAGARGPAGK
ncbi:MAG TPA: phosphatase PAP2 family protein [Gemmatimonadales bacterium]